MAGKTLLMNQLVNSVVDVVAAFERYIGCNEFPALYLELRGWQNDVLTHQSRSRASHVDLV